LQVLAQIVGPQRLLAAMGMGEEVQRG
jgi:hypothetical protein